MINCQACGRRTELYLCTDDTNQLANMLNDLPWLLDELDARIQQLARTNIGTIGRAGRDPAELTPIDFDAAETARAVRKKLLHWVTTVAERHTGRRMPALATVRTKDLARWLTANLNAIQRDNHAGKLYRDINTLVGTDQRGGQLITAINRQERHLVGPCPTITGRHHNGQPRQCQTILFADTYDTTTTCPTCKQDINVRTNRIRTATERDYHTKPALTELLTNMGEPVPETRIDQWIKARRLRPAGTNNNGEPIYSLERARRLRRRDTQLRTRKRILTR